MLATETASIVLKIKLLPRLNRSVVFAMKASDCYQHQEVVQLEIGMDKLEALFNKGELCAADVRCLNGASKSRVWNLCLSACSRRMTCNMINSEIFKCGKQHTEKLQKDSSVNLCLEHEHPVQTYQTPPNG
jgi:hypothetical protein